MNFQYDVIIVGAGPVGSTMAYHLVKQNLNVVIVEKKTYIGYPLQCAGIISTNIHNLNELPSNIILNDVKGAYLHSKNKQLKVQKDKTVAHVIDRIAYDQFLIQRCIDCGVKVINKKVMSCDIEQGIVYLENSEKLTSKIIIGCDGYNSTISKSMGNKQKNFNATQILVEIDGIEKYRKSNESNDEYVDTYITEELAPGFLWIIPIKNNLYRVGLFSDCTHKLQNGYIEKFLDENFTYEVKEKYKGFIPIFDEDNVLVKNRAMLIGDAAAQIKPTSGGGLLMGFDACKIAIEYIVKSVDENDINILNEYEKIFKKKYLKEINYQQKVQKIFSMLSDDDFDYLFYKLKRNDGEKLISEYGDMDNQSILVKEFIKRGLALKIIPSFFIKKYQKIFGI